MGEWGVRRGGGAVAAASLLLVVSATPVGAHGIWGHVHVTGWAIESLPAGELKDFFADPEVFNAALFGSAFTDSGYWPQGGELGQKAHAYAEHTHWEPFVSDFIAYVREHHPPPFESLEAKQRVAFLMGCASHGLQDEIFDSLFLPQVKAHDGGGQEEADPGVDGFLALDGHIRFAPTEVLPLETLLALYAGLDEEITEDVIRASVDVMMFIYLNHENGIGVAEGLGEQYRPVIPWAAEHYLDPAVPGSFRTEILPTARYLEAIWDRLHDRWSPDDLVTHTFPAVPRRLLGPRADTPDAWVTVVFGTAANAGTATASWVDAGGVAVPFELVGTRWSSGGWSRLVRLQPTADLVPGSWYSVTLAAGAELLDGSLLGTPFSFDFQVECSADDTGPCPDLGELPVPRSIPPRRPHRTPRSSSRG